MQEDKSPVYQGSVELRTPRRHQLKLNDPIVVKSSKLTSLLIATITSIDQRTIKVMFKKGLMKGMELELMIEGQTFLPYMVSEANGFPIVMPIAHHSWEFLLEKGYHLYEKEVQGLIPYKVSLPKETGTRGKLAVIITMVKPTEDDSILAKLLTFQEIGAAKTWMKSAGVRLIKTQKR
jgi:hypothetical protein